MRWPLPFSPPPFGEVFSPPYPDTSRNSRTIDLVSIDTALALDPQENRINFKALTPRRGSIRFDGLYAAFDTEHAGGGRNR